MLVQYITLISSKIYGRLLMSIVIFGQERPKISFTQSPSGDISFEIENEFSIEFSFSRNDSFSWKDFYLAWMERQLEMKLISEDVFENSCLYEVAYGDLDKVERRNHAKFEFTNFIEKMIELTGSLFERKFFQDYVNLCGINECPLVFRDCPALIPQFWVNWLHYNFRDKNRAKRARKEPFRVDFVLKDKQLGHNLIIIEIDGSTHYCTNTGIASMEVYTEHLRKDRWLRHEGWQVYRVSNKEIDEYDNIQTFLREIFGEQYTPPNTLGF